MQAHPAVKNQNKPHSASVTSIHRQGSESLFRHFFNRGYTLKIIPSNSITLSCTVHYIPAVIRKCWARDGKWKAPWLHGRQLHYFQRWCFGLHSLFCKGPFRSSTSGWTSMNCWWIGPGWRSSPQQNTNHECCSWRERSTSQLIGYLDALFASSLSHRSLWLCQPVK